MKKLELRNGTMYLLRINNEPGFNIPMDADINYLGRDYKIKIIWSNGGYNFYFNNGYYYLNEFN